jgi:hypothetical protein
MFRFTAFLCPVLGSFYGDSGAGGKKVTPGMNFSGKKYLSSLMTERVWCFEVDEKMLLECHTALQAESYIMEFLS